MKKSPEQSGHEIFEPIWEKFHNLSQCLHSASTITIDKAAAQQNFTLLNQFFICVHSIEDFGNFYEKYD